jgi:hypothetical protein
MIDFDDVAFFNTLMLRQLILYIYTVEPIAYPFWRKLQEIGRTFGNFSLICVTTRQKNF